MVNDSLSDLSPPRQPFLSARLVAQLLLMGVLVWITNQVSAVLVPLVVGLLLAYILDPMVCRIEKTIGHRVAAVVITVGLMIAIAVTLLVIVVPVVSAEFRHGIELAKECTQPDSPMRNRLSALLPSQLNGTLHELFSSDMVRQFVKENAEFQSFVLGVIRRIVPKVWDLLSGALSLLGVGTQLLLALVYLLFLLVDYKRFREGWSTYIPRHLRSDLVTLASEFSAALSCYFRGQLIIVALVGILFSVGFSIIGLRMAVLLGLFVGALNMVPYLQIVGVLPALLLAAITSADRGTPFLSLAVGVILVFIIVQAVQDFLLTPRIMNDATGLPPVVILFSAFFWGQLLGFLGLVLAIPFTCLGLAYYRRAIRNIDDLENSITTN